MIDTWSEVTIEGFQNLWQGFLGFIPNLLAAILIFVIGWFIACGIGRLIAEILIRLKFNSLFKSTGWKESLEKAEFKIDPAGFIGAICKWVLAIVFLLASVEILGLPQFAEFLKSVIAWLPNLIVVAAIFMVAVVFADFLEKIVKVWAKKIGIEQVKLVGTIVRWAVYFFAAYEILSRLDLKLVTVDYLLYGIIGTLTLALGLSFGLGGREAASKAIDAIENKISEKSK